MESGVVARIGIVAVVIYLLTVGLAGVSSSVEAKKSIPANTIGDWSATFYDATDGEAWTYGGETPLNSASDFNIATRSAAAYTGIGNYESSTRVIAFAGVYKVVQCASDGTYISTIVGAYDIEVYACALCLAACAIEYRIIDLGETWDPSEDFLSPYVKARTCISSLEIDCLDNLFSLQYPHSDAGPFSSELSWYASRGHYYAIEVTATAICEGVFVYLSYADAYGYIPDPDRGVWYTSITVSMKKSPPPPEYDSVATLLSPGAGVTDVPTSTSLVWTAPSDSVSYIIEYTGEYDSYHQVTTSSTSLSVSLLGNMHYYWRVFCKSADGVVGPPTEWRVFYTAGNEFYGVAWLCAPDDDATEVPLETMLAWVSPGGCGYYLVEYWDVNTPDIRAYECVEAAAYCLVTLNSHVTYNWHVKCRNTEGIWGPWSFTFSFTTANPQPTTPGIPTWEYLDYIDGNYRITWSPSTDSPGEEITYTLLENYVTVYYGTENQFQVDYNEPGAYYYMVKASDGVNHTNWSTASCLIPRQKEIPSSQDASLSPDIATDDDGCYHIVWVDTRDGVEQIYYKKMDQNWNVMVGDTRVSDSDVACYNTTIAVRSDGVIWVIWDTFDDLYDISVLRVRTYTPGIGWESSSRYFAYDRGYHSTNPDLVTDALGNFHCAFKEDNRDFGTRTERIRYKLNSLNVGSSGVYSLVYMNSFVGSADKLSTPCVAVDSAGVVHILFSVGRAWPGEGDCDSDIWYVNNASGTWSTPVSLSSYEGSPARHCSVSASADGTVYACWDTLGYTIDPSSVTCCVSYDGGNTWTSPIVVPTDGHDDSKFCSQIIAGIGDTIYLSWIEMAYDGSMEVLSIHSHDSGQSWESVVQISEAYGSVELTSLRVCYNYVADQIGFVWTDEWTESSSVFFSGKHP